LLVYNQFILLGGSAPRCPDLPPANSIPSPIFLSPFLIPVSSSSFLFLSISSFFLSPHFPFFSTFHILLHTVPPSSFSYSHLHFHPFLFLLLPFLPFLSFTNLLHLPFPLTFTSSFFLFCLTVLSLYCSSFFLLLLSCFTQITILSSSSSFPSSFLLLLSFSTSPFLMYTVPSSSVSYSHLPFHTSLFLFLPSPSFSQLSLSSSFHIILLSFLPLRSSDYCSSYFLLPFSSVYFYFSTFPSTFLLIFLSFSTS
jgi:hypothetical protein